MHCTPQIQPRASLLSEAETSALRPSNAPLPDPLADMRQRMQRSAQWHPNQMAGRRWPVACVSLEITQRCNLDCTLCYLSDSSEAVRDFPLEEVFRRIDIIHDHFGPGTDVQVSGGEPTLRRRDELVAIVRRLRQRGLRASLFTNGIKATRGLLIERFRRGVYSRHRRRHRRCRCRSQRHGWRDRSGACTARHSRSR